MILFHFKEAQNFKVGTYINLNENAIKWMIKEF